MSSFTSQITASKLIPKIIASKIECFEDTVSRFRTRNLLAGNTSRSTITTTLANHSSFGASLHFLLANTVRKTGGYSIGKDDGFFLNATLDEMAKDHTRVHKHFLKTHRAALAELKGVLDQGKHEDWKDLEETERDIVLLDQLVECWSAHAAELDLELFTEQ